MASMDIGGGAEIFPGSVEAFGSVADLFRLVTGSLGGDGDTDPV